MRFNYVEANIEEDIELKNQYRFRNFFDPISITEAASQIYVDNFFNNPSIIKSNALMDLNDGNITNARFIQVNQFTQIDYHSTAKLFVDNSIDEFSLVRNNQDNDLGNFNLSNINSITLNKQAENDKEDITKAFVDQFRQENERPRRDVGLEIYDESSDLVKNNQDSDLNDNELTNLNSITVNRNPSSDNEVANKKYFDDSIEGSGVLRFNQTLENYLKVSVGNDSYNLIKYNKIQFTDTTVMEAGNTGGYLLPYWKNLCNDKINSGKIQNSIKSTKTNSPTEDSGATSLPPIGIAFMYTETSSHNNGNNAFVSFERTDAIQINKITFYYNRFLILTNDFKNQWVVSEIIFY